MIRIEDTITDSFKPVLRIEIDKEEVMDLMNKEGLSDSEIFSKVMTKIMTKLSRSFGFLNEGSPLGEAR